MANLHPRTFEREKLYDLVWSRPIRVLATEFNLSDVGLAKACKRANIPRPPRGHWAKLKAGSRSRPIPCAEVSAGHRQFDGRGRSARRAPPAPHPRGQAAPERRI